MCVMAVVAVAPVPMFQTGREPNHVTGPNVLDSAAFALNPTDAGRNNQCLTQRMRVPRRPGARLKGDARPGRPRGVLRLK